MRRIAGNGNYCNRKQSTCGEGGNALNASLNWPTIARQTPQGLLIADSADRVMLVGRDGVLHRIAGTGRPGFSGDWGPATSAQLYAPADAIPYRGGILISDGNNCRLRWIDPYGVIKPYAGYGGDLAACWASYAQTNGGPWGGPQTGDIGDGRYVLNSRMSVTGFFATKDNELYVTDFLNSRVRKVDSTDTISTFLGTGASPGVNTDGPMAVNSFQLAWPSGIAYDDVSKKMLVTDSGANRIVGVSFVSDFAPLPAGTVTQVNTGKPNVTVYGNATVTDTVGGGYLTVYPCADGKPYTSNSNYVAGKTVATFVLAHSDAAGNICFYNSNGVNVIWDQLGYDPDVASHTPVRKVDTRMNGTRLAAGETLTVPTGASPGIAVGGTLTAVNAAGKGWLTAFPCGATVPTASNVNFTAAGDIVANTAIVQTDQNGNICVYASTATDVIWDQSVETNTIPITAPVRVVDTRLGGGSPLGAGQVYRISSAPSSRVYANLTVTQPTTGGYATVYPCASPRPLASNINFAAGQTVANFVVANSDRDGGVCVYTTSGTHIIWDQVATKALPTDVAPLDVGPNANGPRLLDTRIAP